MLCGRCLMCQAQVLSFSFFPFLSLSYSLQQRGRERFRHHHQRPNLALIPCIFINRWANDYVFLHPPFSSVYLEREMGNKTASESSNQSRAPVKAAFKLSSASSPNCFSSSSPPLPLPGGVLRSRANGRQLPLCILLYLSPTRNWDINHFPDYS